ncbi:MAG: hypothetical protein ABW133_22280 [Polyangiaceae bacterium]
MLGRNACAWGFGAVVGLAQLGCVVNVDDGERFREPIPQASEVSLALPGASTAASSPETLAFASGAERAKFYEFTRSVSDGVDGVTRAILGSIWIVVHTRPTTVSAHEATWGPGADNALAPVVWRLKVTEVSDGVFDYQLDGRPKGSMAEADYLSVLKGRGYGRSHAEHRNGSFTVDHDNAKTLDPAKNHDQGTTKIDHHLSSWPATIAVAIRPTPAPQWTDITVTHQKDGAGAVDVNALTDIEDKNKDGKLEDVVMHNRWAKDGAGRADVQISGGSVPVLVKATECWSPVFERSYYTDNAGLAPTEGDPASCVFSDPKF